MISELAITEVLSAVARRKREGVLTVDQALEIRAAVADADSGSFDRLVLSPNVHREAEPLVRLAAAARCVAIGRNHPFNDGNKRAALLVTRAFLYLNGQELEPAQADEVATLVGVADGSLSEKEPTGWLERNSRRRPTEVSSGGRIR